MSVADDAISPMRGLRVTSCFPLSASCLLQSLTLSTSFSFTHRTLIS